jgi:hypothetical protein
MDEVPVYDSNVIFFLVARVNLRLVMNGIHLSKLLIIMGSDFELF